MMTVLILASMIEIDDESVHVGMIPCIVNNQLDIMFEFEDFITHLRHKARGQQGKPSL